MKKLTALILTLVMLVSMTAIVPVSAAANEIVVTPAETEITAEPGETLTVVWEHNQDADYKAADFQVLYDPAVFEAVYTGTGNRKQLVAPVLYADDNDYAKGACAVFQTGLIAEGYYTEGPYVGLDGFSGLLCWNDSSITSEAYLTSFFKVTIKVREDAPKGDHNLQFVWISTSDVTYNRMNTPAVEPVVVSIPNGIESEPEIEKDTANITAEGSQVRIPAGNVTENTTFGFRFVSKVANRADAKSYGTLVIPADLLDNEDDLVVGNTDAEDVPVVKFMEGTTDDEKIFNATMTEIYDSNLARDFSYRAYIVLEDGSYVYGEVATYSILDYVNETFDTYDADQQAWLTENVIAKA